MYNRHVCQLGLIVAVFLLSSCLRNPEKQIGAHDYYDIQGLFDQQQKLLRSESPYLIKKVSYKDQYEEKKIKPDSLGWSKELNLFYDTNPNLAANKTSYIEKYAKRNGELLITYSPEDSVRAELKSLQITLNPSDSSIRALRAVLKTKNYLNKEETLLEATFDHNTPHLLKEYFVRTGQKVVTKDSTNFTLIGEVLR